MTFAYIPQRILERPRQAGFHLLDTAAKSLVIEAVLPRRQRIAEQVVLALKSARRHGVVDELLKIGREGIRHGQGSEANSHHFTVGWVRVPS
jgi:hypothetical protein